MMRRFMFGPIASVTLGTLSLVTVLAPSPARLALLGHEVVTTPPIELPANARKLTQAEITAIVARPLFNEQRKKDPPLDSASECIPLNEYRLTGVIAMGQSSIALVERKQTKSTVTVKIGEVLDGRTVKSITNRGVTFAGPEGLTILSVPKLQSSDRAVQVDQNSSPGQIAPAKGE